MKGNKMINKSKRLSDSLNLDSDKEFRESNDAKDTIELDDTNARINSSIFQDGNNSIMELHLLEPGKKDNKRAGPPGTRSRTKINKVQTGGDSIADEWPQQAPMAINSKTLVDALGDLGVR